MDNRGRGKKVPHHIVQEICELYIQKLSEGDYVYSPEQIAEIVCYDPRTVRNIIREESCRALEQKMVRIKRRKAPG